MENALPIPLEQNIVITNLEIKSLISDLRKYEGSMKDLKKLYDFGRSKIIKLRELIDDLQTYASEQTEEPCKKRYLNVVRNEKDQLNRTLRDYQKAYVDCVLSIEKKNKEELFSMSNRENTLKRRGTKSNSVLLQQNADITDHMSSVSRQLAEVIKQSTGALETLVKSSTNITGIGEELKSTGSVIDQSGKLLNKYQQREFTDKILIFFGFAFFVVCVLYVVYARSPI